MNLNVLCQKLSSVVKNRADYRFFSLCNLVKYFPAIFVLTFSFSLQVYGQENRPDILPPQLKGVGIDQRLNGQVPLDLVFRDETGRSVQLKEYFGRKPVILALVYYECPMLCTLILNGMVQSLNGLAFDVGTQFEVISVSFDHRETPELAAKKKNIYLKRYLKKGPEVENGWHFLTGDEKSIKDLTNSVGYRFTFDEAKNQFAHGSAIIVITPEGKISRYFYGVEYRPRDLKLGLVEASANKIGSPMDQIMLFCYHYDPTTGKYTPIVYNIIRLGGILTVLALGTFMITMWRLDFKKSRKSRAA
jgi:protein SCO1